MSGRMVLASLALGATVFAGGCQPMVLDPLGEGGGTSGGDGARTTQGQPPDTTALAYREGDLPQALRHSTTAVWSHSPDAVVLYFSRYNPVTCAEPNRYTGPVGDGCDATIRMLEFAIPPELFHVGKIDTRDRRLVSAFDSNNADCSGGGGVDEGFPAGLELVAISPESIELNLDLKNDPDLDDLSGHYLVHGCSALPPEAPPTPGVAMLGADLPEGAVEGAIDPTALYVFAGTGGSTCDAPVPDLTCSFHFRTVFKIPGGSAQPGTLALPDLDASYAISESRDGCAGADVSRGKLRQGTVTIGSADADQLSFRIAGSYNDGNQSSVDGVFTAKICH